jgi:hypothetical protein
MNDLEIKVEVTKIDPTTGQYHVKISENDFDRIFDHSVQLDGLKIRFFFYLLEDKISSSLNEEIDSDIRFSLICNDKIGLWDIVQQLKVANWPIVSGPKRIFNRKIESNRCERIFLHENEVDFLLEESKKFQYSISAFFQILEIAIKGTLYRSGQRGRFSLNGLDKTQPLETIKKVEFSNFEIVSQ